MTPRVPLVEHGQMSVCGPRARPVVSLLLLAAAAAGCSASQGARVDATVPNAQREQDTARLYASCMAERGYAVELDGRGGSRFDIPAGQEAEATAADEACSAKASAVLGPSRVPTEEELLDRYEFLLEMKTCLEAEGYDISEPPSRDSFVDAVGANWYPFAEIAPTDEAEWARLNERCPQF